MVGHVTIISGRRFHGNGKTLWRRHAWNLPTFQFDEQGSLAVYQCLVGRRISGELLREDFVRILLKVVKGLILVIVKSGKSITLGTDVD